MANDELRSFKIGCPLKNVSQDVWNLNGPLGSLTLMELHHHVEHLHKGQPRKLLHRIDNTFGLSSRTYRASKYFWPATAICFIWMLYCIACSIRRVI